MPLSCSAAVRFPRRPALHCFIPCWCLHLFIRGSSVGGSGFRKFLFSFPFSVSRSLPARPIGSAPRSLGFASLCPAALHLFIRSPRRDGSELGKKSVYSLCRHLCRTGGDRWEAPGQSSRFVGKRRQRIGKNRFLKLCIKSDDVFPVHMVISRQNAVHKIQLFSGV